MVARRRREDKINGGVVRPSEPNSQLESNGLPKTALGVAGAVVGCLAAALTAWTAGPFSHQDASAVEAARLRSMFEPKKGRAGKYPIDPESTRLLKIVEHSASAAVAKIRSQLEENALQLGGRLSLCDVLEKSGAVHASRAQRYDDLASCYKLFMDAFDFADLLEQSDPRKTQLLRMRPTAARTAGDRLLIFSDGAAERIDRAAQYLRAGVLGGSACSPRFECLQAAANLLLALQLQQTGDSQLNSVLQDLRRVPTLEVPWADPWSVHLQLPGIRQQGFWEPADFPKLEEVAARWNTIRSELDTYIATMVSQTLRDVWDHRPESEHLAGVAEWNSVELAMNGVWRDETCAEHFAATCALLRGLPELDPNNFKWPAATTRQPGGPGGDKPPVLMVNIYQAVPGAKIRAHFGTHGRLVASLGLRVPRGASIRVGSEWRQWTEGSWLVFDDSFSHEVINDSREPRYVLAVAMLHPDCCDKCG